MKTGFNKRKLGELCILFIDGDWVETKDQSPSGIRLIQTGNVGIGEFKDRRDKARFVSKDTVTRLKCQEIYPGDCLISRLPDPVGRCCILPDVGERMITAVDCTIARFDNTKLVSEYFCYYSQTDCYLSSIKTLCTGATRERISRSNLSKIEIPLPSLAEQKRIVAILDEAFGAIERAKRIAETNVANARELFDSYLNRVFTEKGEGWEETALEDLVQSESPITYGVVKPGSEGDVAFVRGGDLRDGEVLVSQLRTITSEVSEQYKRTLLKGGELLVCLVGVPGQVGIAPPELAEANIARQVGLVRLRDEIDARFVSYFLLSKPGKEGLGGYTGGSVQQVINLRDLKKVKVPLPTDHSEQVQIGKQIHSLRNHTRRLQGLSKSKFNALDELKQSILQKAFTGQLTAKSPELEAVP